MSFESKAIEALDSKGIRWEVVYKSQSLSGIWPAVSAGIGITVRTSIGCHPSLKIINNRLPTLGNIGVQIHRAQEVTNNVRKRLIDLITKEIKSNINNFR